MTTDTTPLPGRVRVLGSSKAGQLADLMAVFEDLQTALRCCEQLIDELGRTDAEPDTVRIEAIWTLALMSYARGFAQREGGAVLTEDDVVAPEGRDALLDWHRMLLKLRKHYTNPRVNPRERFSVGVAQDVDGAPSGIAVTSARQPLPDDVTVRQTGAIAYALSNRVNERINAEQASLFDDVARASAIELAKLPIITVSSASSAG